MSLPKKYLTIAKPSFQKFPPSSILMTSLCLKTNSATPWPGQEEGSKRKGKKEQSTSSKRKMNRNDSTKSSEICWRGLEHRARRKNKELSQVRVTVSIVQQEKVYRLINPLPLVMRTARKVQKRLNQPVKKSQVKKKRVYLNLEVRLPANRDNPRKR